MKKAAKKTQTDHEAPVWFAPAMRDILKDYPTKDDLDARLKSHPTKNDLDARLKNFATKDDLKSFATKDDLRDMRAYIAQHFATKDDLRDMSEYIIGSVADKLDRRTTHAESRIGKLQKAVTDHETRIISLEAKSSPEHIRQRT